MDSLPQAQPNQSASATTSKPQNELNELLHRLEDEFGIPGLKRVKSVSTESENRGGATCRSLIQYIFYKDRQALNKCLEDFRSLPQVLRNGNTLQSLLQDQKVKIPTPSKSRSSIRDSFASEAASKNTSFTSIFSQRATSAGVSATSAANTSTTSGGLHIAYDELNLSKSEEINGGALSPPPSPSPHPKPLQRRMDDWYKISKANHSVTHKRYVQGACNENSYNKNSLVKPEPPDKVSSNRNERNHLSSRETEAEICANPPEQTNVPRDELEVARGEEQKAKERENMGRLQKRGENAKKIKPEPWQIKELPDQEFFTNDIPADLYGRPLRVRYECLRYAVYHRVKLSDMAELLPNGSDNLSEVQAQLASLEPNVARRRVYEMPDKNAWNVSNEANWCDKLSLSGSIQSQTLKEPRAFALKLHPIRLEQQSNRFFRKFGSHRFLKILIPGREGIIHDFKEETIARLSEWLNVPRKRLLGCSWTAFYIKSQKNTKKSVERFGEARGRHVYFFAESGPGLPWISIKEMLHWFLPFPSNKDLLACKAFSRLQLGFTSTTPTVVFKPRAVYKVPQSLGNGAPEDDALNDTTLKWDSVLCPDKPRIMNDGCEMISAAAAKLVWQMLEEPGPVPSAFQARIGPWKGVWFVASTPHHGLINEEDIWIRVNETQQKWEQHEEDKADFTFDESRLTFEVREWSRKPVSSSFYLEFLPILEDRGVSRESCRAIVQEWLEAEKQEAVVALSHSMRTLEWIQSKKAVLSTFAEGTEWCGHRQKTKAQVVQSLIQSGFSIRTSSYLVEMVVSTMISYFTTISNDLRIRIPRSTSLFGIADPWAILAPNEISVVFSDPKLAGSPILCDTDALVSRHPALRSSDIQRVRVVCKPELAYLVDVVVFPVTGSYPLANKLQGGDYDGDTFWLCWEPRVVQNFRNAPPPADSPNPEKFQISVDRTTCGYFMEWGDFESRFLRHCFTFQLQDGLLGQCTNYYKRVRYTLNSFHNPEVLHLADIHDLLVDWSKMGYSFSQTAWNNQLRQNTRLRNIKEPFYEQAHNMKLDDDEKAQGWRKLDDIIDFLVFDVARSQCRRIVKDDLEAAKSIATHWDDDLGRLWRIVNEEFGQDPEIREVLGDLHSKLKSSSPFYAPWKYAALKKNHLKNNPFATEDTKKSLWNESGFECRKRFQEILPLYPNHHHCKAWLLKHSTKAIPMWEFIKASALFTEWHSKQNFVFTVAGDILCQMKASSLVGTESVVAPVLQRTKIRKRRFREVDFVSEVEVARQEPGVDANNFVADSDGNDLILNKDTLMLLPVVPVDAPTVASYDLEDTSTQYSWPEVPEEEPGHCGLNTSHLEPQPPQVEQLNEDYSQLSVD